MSCNAGKHIPEDIIHKRIQDFLANADKAIAELQQNKTEFDEGTGVIACDKDLAGISPSLLRLNLENELEQIIAKLEESKCNYEHHIHIDSSLLENKKFFKRYKKICKKAGIEGIVHQT